MLKSKPNTLSARIKRSIDKGAVIIDSGSLVYDNKWIEYNGTLFEARRYIESKLNETTRRRFFTGRNYAVQILIGVDSSGSVRISEGTQSLFSTKESVSVPSTYGVIPLVSVLLIQDGSSDLNYGFRALNESNVTFFSGAGNVLDKNLTGPAGIDSYETGMNGPIGFTGLKGLSGETGYVGNVGTTGSIGDSTYGITGPQGMTGINWDINIPFDNLF